MALHANALGSKTTRFSWVFFVSCTPVQLVAAVCCAAFRATLGSTLVLGVFDRQVVSLRNLGVIAWPVPNDVDRVDLCQVCLARGPQVVKQLRPGTDAGPLNYPW
jgi:hypothetical protein